jgi:hypothetical protein
VNVAITLYQKKELKGKSLEVSRNYRDLDNSTESPSSLDMTAASDAVLLFKQKDWDGGVMYYRGKRKMTSLGKTAQGGEFLSGNTVRSVRVTPFTLKLNVTVVCKFLDPENFRTSGYRYPGDQSSEQSVESFIGKAVVLANSFFDKEKAMIQLETGDYSYLPNDAKSIEAGGGRLVPSDVEGARPGRCDRRQHAQAGLRHGEAAVVGEGGHRRAGRPDDQPGRSHAGPRDLPLPRRQPRLGRRSDGKHHVAFRSRAGDREVGSHVRPDRGAAPEVGPAPHPANGPPRRLIWRLAAGAIDRWDG